MFKKYKKLILPVFLFFIAMIYVVFSWHDWSYGGGFACRPLIDTLPVLAIPLASLISYISYKTHMFFRIGFGLLLLFCIALNLFQSYQYYLGLLNFGGTTKAYYWKVFGKTKVEPDDWKLNIEN